MSKILIKFPSRSRPDKFFACLDNILHSARHDDFEVLATLDLDDETMANPEVRDRIKQYPMVRAYWGTSNSKIQAINRDMEFAGEFDILLLWSDDMWIDKDGFDRFVVASFNNFSGLLHLPDGHANSRLVTLPIMDRAYYQLDNFVYNPIYKSVYADNEQMAVAKLRGKYKYVHESWYTHRHPIWGYGKADAQLRHTESFYPIDQPTFLKRQAENFGL